MKTSEKLLNKIFDKFPQICTKNNSTTSLRTVRGVNDGCKYSWSNGCGFDDHIFSYSTMKECLVRDIEICHHLYKDGNHGYEIYVVETKDEQT